MAINFALAGTEVPAGELRIHWARAFARYIAGEGNHAFDLVACRQAEDLEIVEIRVRAEVPQLPKYPILYEEPLAVAFTPDNQLPAVLSLRPDFPDVPHLNLTMPGDPKSLCLFAEPPEEIKLRWTPALLGLRILWWLRDTALGKLHGEDQPLEPFVLGRPIPLILPPDVFATGEREVLVGYETRGGPAGTVIVADRPGLQMPQGAPITLIPFSVEPQVHGVIRVQPESLADLHDMCAAAGLDLLGELRRLLLAKVEMKGTGAAATMLVIGIPQRRSADGPVERLELRAFRCMVPRGDRAGDIRLQQLGEALKLLTRSTISVRGLSEGEKYVPAFATSEVVADAAKGVIVQMLTPLGMITREQAALVSGLGERSTTRFFAIGQGALGSQVFAHLARQSYGEWTLVDNDFLAPHNFVRHAIFGRRLGFSKAQEMAKLANELFVGPPVATGYNADILAAGNEPEALLAAAAAADFIVDFSASIPVARFLALDLLAPSQRIAEFLSPNGRDLVLMKEGEKRQIPLDVIEAQYYRALLNDARLAGHLGTRDESVRYGGSCRDLSARISPELVGLHAAIGARALRQVAQQPDAQLTLWRCDPESMTVAHCDVPLAAPIVCQINDWTIVTDQGLIDKVVACRAERLPNETCGVLLGYLDTQRRRAYVVDVLPAPADSVEEPGSCERGIAGLRDAVAACAKLTLDQLDYIGEWHSHPDGAVCLPSERDLIQMAWIEGKLHPEGKPAIMLIACENGKATWLVVEPDAGNDVVIPGSPCS